MSHSFLAGTLDVDFVLVTVMGIAVGIDAGTDTGLGESPTLSSELLPEAGHQHHLGMPITGLIKLRIHACMRQPSI